ncbi:Alpha/Beta hydrolase protein [Hypoxylon cercidicola]|nr:Alpha/Beta hydrolase protein [Hypoxylon cercidicola]
MANIPTSEGRVPFMIPGKIDVPCSTYYKVFGDLASGAPPVIALHGGPGGGHEYLLPFAELWPLYGLPVVFYDQIGCGASTHLPQMSGNADFWQESLFIAELANLIDHLKLRDGPGFHLLGQSWGGDARCCFCCQSTSRFAEVGTGQWSSHYGAFCAGNPAV